MNESHLIQIARQGDLGSFNRLVLAYQDLVFQHAVWMLRKPEDAEAVTQETFLLAYSRLGSFRDGDFHCWLLKIASRLCLEELHQREQGHPSRQVARANGSVRVGAAFRVTDRSGSPEGNSGQNDLLETVQDCLSKLSPNPRTILTLVDLEGMDYFQVAEILGISVRSVKIRLARARVGFQESS